MGYGDSPFRRGGVTLRKSNIMAEHEAQICPKCSTLLIIKFSQTADYCEKCGVWYDDDSLGVEQQRREKRLAEKVKTSPQGSTLFIPFIRGTSASMSEQFVDHGGRTGGSAADGIADDLTAMVGKYEAKGYEFQKIEAIHVDVSPGCIGALMGKGKEYHPYDYLVFKKTSEPISGQSA